MAMAVDNQQRQFGGMDFGHMPYSMSTAPQFTNPWTSSSAPTQNNTSYAPPSHGVPSNNLSLDIKPRVNSNVSMQSYAPITASSADMLSPNRMQPTSAGYGSEASYTSSASPTAHSSAYPATSQTPYETLGYAPAPVRSTYALQSQPDNSRRLSQPSVPSSSPAGSLTAESLGAIHRQNHLIDSDYRTGLSAEQTRSFGDAIDASRGMIAMSQDTTPRNIYGPGARGGGSVDSYGFPGNHSNSSSISSSSDYPSYFAGPGSVHSSVSDYSNASSDIESVSSRTLPRPSGLIHGGMPPAPQSMMGQFSSKVSSSTQKKHKCKVCDKRFTRPSSLQTHMYSHTGEKPFHCKVEGCGRHFSVVSNLRRHRKVHKGEALSETGSEDHQSDE